MTPLFFRLVTKWRRKGRGSVSHLAMQLVLVLTRGSPEINDYEWLK